MKLSENEKEEFDIRENTQRLAADSLEKGDATGWFDILYKEAAGDNKHIPWADLETNKFLVRFAEKTNLRGDGRKALVVGCGLGDDARFLFDLGFEVTGFDISETAIEWAKRLHADTSIDFHAADLFAPPRGWLGAFKFVLEVYTIQPLPLGMRPQTIDAIARFVAPKGKLVVVTRGREDDEEPLELPWALSRRDLSQFERNDLKQIHFEEMLGDEDESVKRFVVEYQR